MSRLSAPSEATSVSLCDTASIDLADYPVETTRIAFPGDDPGIRVSLGDNNEASFTGYFESTPARPHGFVALGLHVSPEYRGRGAASRLVGALAHAAVEQGATTMRIPVQSPHVIRIFRNTFEPDGLRYYDSPAGSNGLIELPMSSEQAVASLTRTEEWEDDLEKRKIGFWVEVDLSRTN